MLDSTCPGKASAVRPERSPAEVSNSSQPLPQASGPPPQLTTLTTTSPPTTAHNPPPLTPQHAYPAPPQSKTITTM